MNASRAAAGFLIFAALHVLVWTLLPVVTIPNMTIDWPELLYFARELHWTYSKHPPLTYWVFALFERHGGPGLAGLYLTSQLCVAAAFACVWRLGRTVLSPARALASVAVLEAVYFYTFLSPEFNQNILILPFWAGTAFFLRRAAAEDRSFDWILCGAAAGLGLLTKYSIAALLLPVFLFTVLHPEVRKRWRGAGPWTALAVCAAIVVPHVAALAAEGGSALRHAHGRLDPAVPHAFKRLYNPVEFLAIQTTALLPVIAVIAAACRGRLSRLRLSADTPQSRDLAFLDACFLGPIAFCLVLTAAFGFRMSVNMYGAPLALFAGVWIFARFRPVMDPLSARRFAAGVALVAVISAAAFAGQYLVSPYIRGKGKRGHFPGRAVAAQLDEAWTRSGRGALPAIAGNTWIAGNAAYYSKFRPRVYSEVRYEYLSLDREEAAFRRSGGVIVWDAAKQGAGMPEGLRGRFGHAQIQPEALLAWHTRAKVPPFRLGWAVLAPEGENT